MRKESMRDPGYLIAMKNTVFLFFIVLFLIIISNRLFQINEDINLVNENLIKIEQSINGEE